mmetsp:Transcript_23729/g.34547  ORF Transcript_23729/g.34547 Transcript_23729/m.34547 type:complete len:512 (+) Transcript_23729:119-1654(+)
MDAAVARATTSLSTRRVQPAMQPRSCRSIGNPATTPVSTISTHPQPPQSPVHHDAPPPGTASLGRDGVSHYKMSQARLKRLQDAWDQASSSSSSGASESSVGGEDQFEDVRTDFSNDEDGMLARASNWWQRRRQRLQREALEQQAEEQRQRILQQLHPEQQRSLSLADLYCGHSGQDDYVNSDSDDDDNDTHAENGNGNEQLTHNNSNDTVSSIPGLYKTTSVDSTKTPSRKIKVGPILPTPSGCGVTVDLTLPSSSDSQREEEQVNGTDDNDDIFIAEVSIEPETYSKYNPNSNANNNMEQIPYILTKSQMLSIAKKVLPPSMAYCRWKRVYSLLRDGDAFDAFLRLVHKEQRTLLVIKTSKGDVFGGYAETAWEVMHRRENSGGFYGSAQACLFKLLKKNVSNDDCATSADANGYNDDIGRQQLQNSNDINVYRWTGRNRYIQLCDSTHKMIAFGGGGTEGSFGLTVEDDFRRGSTGYCDTFGNDALCHDGEDFDVIDLECWGFITGVF